MDHRKLNFPMKKPLPAKNTLLAIAKGDSFQDDGDCLVDNEEIPDYEFTSAPGTPVTPVTVEVAAVTKLKSKPITDPIERFIFYENCRTF